MTHIGPHPTPEMYQSGDEIDCQCARCGSSCDWMECDCDDGYLNDAGTMCQVCGGYGGRQFCMSSAAWCEDNPLPGREDVRRGEIEWFTVRRQWRE